MSSVDESADAKKSSQPFGISEFQRRQPLTGEEYRRFREEYGYLRAFFKSRPRRYAKVQQSLNQSHMETTFEEYLSRSVWYALVVGILGAFLGAVFTMLLSEIGVLAGLRSPVTVGGGLSSFIGANRVFFVGVALTLGGGGLFGGGVWAARYYYPQIRRSLRRQEINVVLPHGIVFMYAMSHGGASLFETFQSLADAHDSYGEVSNEFEMIVNDIELFGTDMHTAIRNARRMTPSKGLERFFDDLLSLLESGGDVTVFLEEQTETYLRKANEEQENFLETVSLLAEVFVVVFVAAPLFLIVTLVLVDILGGDSLQSVILLVYAGMPLAMVGFILLVDLLGQPFESPETTTALQHEDISFNETALADDERFEDYSWNRRKESLREALGNPRAALRLNPLYTMVVTFPVAAVVIAVQVLFGGPVASLEGITATPVATTTALFLAPFLVVAVPLTLFHELKRQREQEITEEFPDSLNVLASANKMGIRFTESLALVSRWSTGAVGEELRTVRNDIVWNHDVRRALLEFGDRVSVSRLGRTMKLLAEGIYSSGNLSKVLEIAAADMRDRDENERARRRELSTYIVVVVIGFLVYLLVIVMLNVGYLQVLSEFSGEPVDQSGPLVTSFQSVPVQIYQAVFFHSALIQAIGTGLLAGKLADNDVLSGLKYGIALALVTLGVFLFI